MVFAKHVLTALRRDSFPTWEQQRQLQRGASRWDLFIDALAQRDRSHPRRRR